MKIPPLPTTAPLYTASAIRPNDGETSAAEPVDEHIVADSPTPAPGPEPAPMPPAPPTGSDPAPAPDPVPTPAPAPDIDLSVIDTPAKAALLPVLQPEFMLTCLAGIPFAVENNASYAVTESGTAGTSTTASLTYAMPAGPLPNQLTGDGAFAGQPTHEVWLVDDKGMHITGTIGSNAEHIDVTTSPDGLAIRGTIGQVRVDETERPSADGNGSIFDGFLNDAPVHMKYTQETGANGGLQLHLEGTIGSAAVLTDETVEPREEGGLILHTQGQVAGQAVSFDHTVETVQPDGG